MKHLQKVVLKIAGLVSHTVHGGRSLWHIVATPLLQSIDHLCCQHLEPKSRTGTNAEKRRYIVAGTQNRFQNHYNNMTLLDVSYTFFTRELICFSASSGVALRIDCNEEIGNNGSGLMETTALQNERWRSGRERK